MVAADVAVAVATVVAVIPPVVVDVDLWAARAMVAATVGLPVTHMQLGRRDARLGARPSPLTGCRRLPWVTLDSAVMWRMGRRLLSWLMAMLLVACGSQVGQTGCASWTLKFFATDFPSCLLIFE